MTNFSRGDIWLADLNPVRGHEQGGRRPCLVVSHDFFNQNALGLVVIVPFTTKWKGFPSQVEMAPQQTGLHAISFAKCEDMRSVTMERLAHKIGAVPESLMKIVEDRLKIILGL